MTDTRRRVFLETLANTGSSVAAAQAATPWSEHRLGGLSTFRDLAARDPEFRDAWDRAEQAALAKVEEEIMRRAMTPETRPVFSKGEVVGEQRTYDNRLLVALARRLNPEAWSERQRVEHTGEVQHSHRHGHAVITIEARDVLLLDDRSEREQLMLLLEKIAEAKEPGESARLPAPGAA